VKTIYQIKGFDNRREYLEHIADEYCVPLAAVFATADLLGKTEDFDGLVSLIKEYEC
jgi:hypothetical protein